MSRKNSKKNDKRVEKNWLEWAVFGVGLLLVSCALGFLVYDGASKGDAPPSTEVRLGTPERREHNFVVPVAVTNHGDETAEGVQVEVLMEGGGAGAGGERGEFVVAFLPRGGTREASVTFHTDPAAGTLRARVLGYEKP